MCFHRPSQGLHKHLAGAQRRSQQLPGKACAQGVAATERLSERTSSPWDITSGVVIDEQ